MSTPCKTFKTHAGIDVRVIKRRVVVVAVVLKLCENEVPNLNVTVAVATHAAGGLAAAILFAAVKINFGTRTARAGAMLPEVIFSAEAYHVRRVYAVLLCPDVKRFIVVLINGDIKPICRHLENLCKELPSPGGRFLFEVIAKGEVAKHLEECTVACRDAHALDIRGTDALLAGGHTMTGRLLLCQEPLLHGSHAAVDQQQAGVILRHQREAVQTQMALTFKKAQVLFAQFIQTGPLHKFSLLNCPWRLHVRFL